jgi:hypothetical protein
MIITNVVQGEDNINMQGQSFFDTRGFRIAVIAVAALAILALAAYWFGSGLRADTSASVAPSPLGSSLTVDKARTASAAAGFASAGSFSADYASLGLPAAVVVGESRSADVYGSSSAMAWDARLASAAAREESRSADVFGSSSTSSAVASAASLAPFYAGLDKGLRDQGIRP